MSIGSIWPWKRRLRKELQQTPLDLPAADAFWSAFQKRAVGLRQDVPETRVAAPWMAPAFATALVLLLAGGILFWQASDLQTQQTTQVEVLDTGDDVYSYMIWDDAAGRGTLLWLIQDESAGKGGS